MYGPSKLVYIIMTADIRYIIYHFGTSVIQPTGEVSLPESPRGQTFGFKVSVDPAGTCLDCCSTLSLSLSLSLSIYIYIYIYIYVCYGG